MRGISEVRDLVAHAPSQPERTSVPQLGDEFAVKNEKNVPAIAPVIREISGAVLNLSHSDISDQDRTPIRRAGFSRVRGDWNAIPINDLERPSG